MRLKLFEVSVLKKIHSKIFLLLQTETTMSHTNAYHSKYSKKQYCPVRCSTDVELDLDVKPRVACREISRRGTEFDVELDFEVKHNCKLIPKKTYKDECGCVTRCVFGVQLDFDCIPKIRHNPCSKPTAEFELDVELDVTPHCKPIEDCKIRYYKYDKAQEKNHDSEEDFEKEDYFEPKPPKRNDKKKEKKCDESSSHEDKEPCFDKKSFKRPSKKFDDKKFDDKKFDDIDCDCDVCKPKHKKEKDSESDSDCDKKDDKKKSYWL